MASRSIRSTARGRPGAASASWIALRDQLDPFALSQAIDCKIERLLTLATTSRARLVPRPASASVGPTTRVVRRRAVGLMVSTRSAGDGLDVGCDGPRQGAMLLSCALTASGMERAFRHAAVFHGGRRSETRATLAERRRCIIR